MNLQFGTFGISAWPTDTGCTSQAGNADESFTNAAEGSSRHVLSSSGSPKKSDGHCKEVLTATCTMAVLFRLSFLINVLCKASVLF